MGEEERWTKLEQIVRKVVREELAGLGKKAKVEFENGRWKGITEEQMSAWKAAYGAVDVEAELKKAAAWIVSNPHLAPQKQVGRFLNSWFARQQDRSSIRSIPTKQELTAPGPGRKLCAYCEKVATGSVGSRWTCSEHVRNAMSNDPIPHMRGVIAKAVAGE